MEEGVDGLYIREYARKMRTHDLSASLAGSEMVLYTARQRSLI